jgi:hypothetical protein
VHAVSWIGVSLNMMLHPGKYVGLPVDMNHATFLNAMQYLRVYVDLPVGLNYTDYLQVYAD